MDQTTSNKPSAKHLVALTQETFFSVFGPSFDPNYPPKLLEATWKKLVYNFGDYITRETLLEGFTKDLDLGIEVIICIALERWARSKIGEDPPPRNTNVEVELMNFDVNLPEKLWTCSSKSTKYALLIGINFYPYLKIYQQLKGCVNDIVMLEEILIKKYNFPQDCILKLMSTERDAKEIKPTKLAILRALEELSNLIESPETVVVIYFSGHGSQKSNPEKHSSYFETLLPCDSGRWPYPDNDITDDQFRSILFKFNEKTKHIALFFDSCHSGSITRSLSNCRCVPPNDELAIRKGEKRIENSNSTAWLPSISSVVHSKVDYVLLSACNDFEITYEFDPPDCDGKYGIFTYYFCKELMKLGPNSTYIELFEKMSPLVTLERSYQHPQIVGTIHKEIFGLHEVNTDAYFVVMKVKLKVNIVRISGGSAHGLMVGSILSVYPIEVKVRNESTASQLLCRLEVIKVDAVTSECELIPDGSKVKDIKDIPRNSHVFEDETDRCREMQLKVYLPPASYFAEKGVNLDRLFDSITKAKLIHVVDEMEKSEVRVDLVKRTLSLSETKYFLVALNPDGKFYFPFNPIEDQLKFFRNIEKLARYRFITQLQNTKKNSVFRNEVTASIVKRETPKAPWKEVSEMGSDKKLYEGEFVGIQIKNETKQDIYVNVIELMEDGSITCIYPEESKASERIAPGLTFTVGNSWGSVRISNEYLELCKNIPSSDIIPPKEVLKVFVTSATTEFASYFQKGYEGKTQNKTEAASSLEMQLDYIFSGGNNKIIKMKPRGVDDWHDFTFVFSVEPDIQLSNWIFSEFNFSNWNSKLWQQYMQGSCTAFGEIFKWLLPRESATFIRTKTETNHPNSPKLIFIHGVFQDEEETWTNEYGDFWPLWLNQEFPSIDIWTVRHQAIWGQATLEEISTDVATQLLKMKNFESSPLIFISHSLGGNIMQKILSQHENIRKNTKGLVFYSTPEQPRQLLTDIQNWALRFLFFTWKEMKQESIQKGLKEMEDLQSKFHQVAEKIPMLKFVESKPTYNGISLVKLPEDKKTYCIVNSDHVRVSKPNSNQDPNYLKLKEFVMKLISSK